LPATTAAFEGTIVPFYDLQKSGGTLSVSLMTLPGQNEFHAAKGCGHTGRIVTGAETGKAISLQSNETST